MSINSWRFLDKVFHLFSVIWSLDDLIMSIYYRVLREHCYV